MREAVENYEAQSVTWSLSDGWRATRVFEVDFDEDDPLIDMNFRAAAASRIPENLEPHPSKEFIVVTSKDIIRTGPKVCQVNVNYESSTLALAGQVNRRWFFVASQEDIDQDIDGFAIANSSGEPYETPVSRIFNDLACQFSWRATSFDEDQAARFIDHLNSDNFLTFEPGMAKIAAFEGNETDAEDGLRWETIVEVHFRRDGWEKRIVDQGYRKVNGINEDGTPDTEEIKDTNGELPRAPVLLDGNGNVKPENADDVFREHVVFPSANFAELNLNR